MLFISIIFQYLERYYVFKTVTESRELKSFLNSRQFGFLFHFCFLKRFLEKSNETERYSEASRSKTDKFEYSCTSQLNNICSVNQRIG